MASVTVGSVPPPVDELAPWLRRHRPLLVERPRIRRQGVGEPQLPLRRRGEQPPQRRVPRWPWILAALLLVSHDEEVLAQFVELKTLSAIREHY